MHRTYIDIETEYAQFKTKKNKYLQNVLQRLPLLRAPV